MGLALALLAMLSACNGFDDFAVPAPAGLVVLPEGDTLRPEFSTEVLAYTFELRDLQGFNRVFVTGLNTGITEEANIPALKPTDLGTNNPFPFLVDGDSFGGSLDNTGRFVVFLSNATNLVFPFTRDIMHAYIRDLESETTELISMNEFGEDANAPTTSASISGNGGYVVFATSATNLNNVFNGFSQIFVWDLLAGRLLQISIETAPERHGLPGNGDSFNPAITADGRFVAFESDATNLVPGDLNGIADIYAFNRSTLTMTRVSGALGGQNPAMSLRGEKIVYQARDAASIWQIFLYDTATMTTTQITAGNGHSRRPSIDSLATFVAYHSDATDLVPGDTNGFRDVFIYNIATGNTAMVSIRDGIQGDAPSENPSLSSDARVIAFQTAATTFIDPVVGTGRATIIVRENPLGP
jgi:hypothetical protein